MKTVILNVVCSGCLQDAECVGTGTADGIWYCKKCAEQREYPHKAEVLTQSGWFDSLIEKKKMFRVEVTACISRTYEVEAEDEDEARENYWDGDLVYDDEDYEEVDSVRVILDDSSPKVHSNPEVIAK